MQYTEIKTYRPDCTNTSFVDPSKTVQDVALQEDLLNEAVGLYGINISYFPYRYRLDHHNYLYGEDVTAPFDNPVTLKALVQYQQDALLLSKFGMMNDADLNVVITIRNFTEATSGLSGVTEPMMEDLIRLDDLGNRPGGGYDLKTSATNIINTISGIDECEDPEEFAEAYAETLSALIETTYDNWIRGAPIFEITEKRDLAPTLGINALMGVYAYHIKAKRMDATARPQEPVEPGSNQVSDETLYGKLTGGTETPEPPKKYDQNAEDASNIIFDYGHYHGGYTDTYGKY